MADSPTFAYCHLLFSCKVSSDFSGNIALSWLRNIIMTVFVENIKEDVIFVKFDVGDDFRLFNHILLLGKFYIYSRKCQNVIPPLQVSLPGQNEFKILIELHIARKRGKLNNHLKKWEKLISVFFFLRYM